MKIKKYIYIFNLQMFLVALILLLLFYLLLIKTNEMIISFIINTQTYFIKFNLGFKNKQKINLENKNKYYLYLFLGSCFYLIYKKKF